MKTVGCNDKSKQTAFKQKAQFKEFFSENVFIKDLQPMSNSPQISLHVIAHITPRGVL